MDGLPKTYTDTMDEFLAWNANAGDKAPKFANVGDYAKFMDQREGSDVRKSAYDPNFLQTLNQGIENVMSTKWIPGAEAVFPGTVYAGDVGQAYGEVAGETLDKTLGTGERLTSALGGVGRSMPRALVDTALMTAGGPAGWGVTAAKLGTKAAPLIPKVAGMFGGLADAAIGGYAPHQDVVAGAMVPLTMGAASAVIPPVEAIAQGAVASAMTPRATLSTLAQTLADAPAWQQNVVAATRIGAGAAAGTAVNEVSRVATEALKGENPDIFDPVSIAANLVQSAAFAPIDMQHRIEPVKVLKAARTAEFNRIWSETAKQLSAEETPTKPGRGQLINSILQARLKGEDPTPLMEQLKNWHDEKNGLVDVGLNEGLGALNAFKESADAGEVSDMGMVNLLNTVIGRFDEIAAADPKSQLPDTIGSLTLSKLITEGKLPKLSEVVVSDAVKKAYEQSLGSNQALNAHLVGLIVQEYQKHIPTALEQMRQAAGGGETELGTRRWHQEVEGFERDKQYVNALLDLRNKFGARTLEDGTPVADALYEMNNQMILDSEPTDIRKVQAARGRFENWQEILAKYNETWDGETGVVDEIRKVKSADGKLVTKKLEMRLSPEDLVAQEGAVTTGDLKSMGEEPYETPRPTEKGRKKYLLRIPSKKVQSVSMSGETGEAMDMSALMDHYKEQFGDYGDEHQAHDATGVDAEVDVTKPADVALKDRANPDEVSRAADDTEAARLKELVKSSEDSPDEVAPEGTVAETSSFDPTDEGQFQAVVKVLRDVITKPGIWQKYGVGLPWNAAKGGKQENFPYAIQTQIELDALGKDKNGKSRPLDKFTPAMKQFYEIYARNLGSNASMETPKTLDEFASFKEATAALREAIRSYWPKDWGRTTEDKGTGFKGLMHNMLSEYPQYQDMLAGRKPDEKLATKGESAPGVAGRLLQLKGQTGNNVFDTARMYYRFGMGLGYGHEDAQNMADMTAKMAAAFPDFAQVGRLETNEPGVVGTNEPVRAGEKPNIGIGFKNIIANERSVPVMSVEAIRAFAHELTHNYSRPVEKPTVAWKMRRIAHEQLKGLFEELGPQATTELIQEIIAPMFTPEELRSQTPTSLTVGGVFSPDEAVSILMEHTMLGAFSRDNPAQALQTQEGKTFMEATKWLPENVQAYQRLAFRDMANFGEAMKDAYKEMLKLNPPQAERERLKLVMNRIDAMLAFSNKFISPEAISESIDHQAIAARTITAMHESGAVQWDDPVMMRTILYRTNEEGLGLDARKRDTLRAGMTEMQEDMFNKPAPVEKKQQTINERLLGRRLPWWSHWLGLHYQALKRFERIGVGGALPDQVARLENSLEPGYFRVSGMIFEPFTTKDKNGHIIADPNNPVHKLLTNQLPESEKAWNALKNLALWAQGDPHNKESKTGRPVVEDDQNGKTVVADGAQDVVKRELGGLAAETQQAVLEGLNRFRKAYINAADTNYNSQVEHVGTKVASRLMTADPTLYWDAAFNKAQAGVQLSVQVNQAQKQVEMIQETIANIKRQAPQGQLITDPALQNAELALQSAVQKVKETSIALSNALTGLSPDQMAVFEKYVNGPTGAAQKLVELREKLDSRSRFFMSESRAGRFLVFAKTPEGHPYGTGEPYSAGFKTQREAFAHEKKLAAEGYQEVHTLDRHEADATRMFNSPDAVVNDFIQMEQTAWENYLKEVKGLVGPDEFAALSQIGYTPGEASEKYLLSKSMERYMMDRKLRAGREELDPWEVLTDYSRRFVGSVVRRGVKNQIDLILRDPRIKYEGEFQNTIKKAVDTLMQPVSNDFMVTRAAMTGMFLGLPNVVSPVVETTQLMTSVFPELVRESKGFGQAVKYFTNAPMNIFKLSGIFKTFEGKKLIADAEAKYGATQGTGKGMTKDETMALFLLRSENEGRFKHGIAQQMTLGTDASLLSQAAVTMGNIQHVSPAELAQNALYWMAKKSMALYSAASGYNNKIAFTAGLDMLYDRGLRGQELYDAAHLFKDRATYGGGKPNEIGFVGQLSNPRTRSAFSLVTTLQKYAYGQATMLKDYVADTIGTTNLPPIERVKAAKALTAALGAQIMFAGAMGLPGAMILAAVAEQFGMDPKQGAREVWLKMIQMLTDDDQLAVRLANVAQNGVAGQFLGVDVSSRFAINSFLGFNAFDGFNASGLFGVPAGMMQRLVDAGQYVAKGDMVNTAKQFLPPSLSPVIDIADQQANYGIIGIRAADGKLLAPMTGPETALYGIGLRPYKYREFRDQQRSLKLAEAGLTQVKNRQVDEAASALRQGNSAPAYDWVRSYLQQSPMSDPKAAMRSVVDRALVQTNAQDLLAHTVTGGGPTVTRIAQSFGDAAPRQSEFNLLMQRDRLNAATGYMAGEPVDGRAVDRAMFIDAVVKSRGVPRNEATRMADMLGF